MKEGATKVAALVETHWYEEIHGTCHSSRVRTKRVVRQVHGLDSRILITIPPWDLLGLCGAHTCCAELPHYACQKCAMSVASGQYAGFISPLIHDILRYSKSHEMADRGTRATSLLLHQNTLRAKTSPSHHTAWPGLTSARGMF